jgi:competence protein ComEC
MSDYKIHFLNVKNGDCAIIQHSSGRVTMIDICCGNFEEAVKHTGLNYMSSSLGLTKPSGNFRMKENPTNPISYLTNRYILDIYRFILTHPDMDHMDGISNLFKYKNVSHFWDCGVRKEKPDFNGGSPYKEEDWEFYEKLIQGSVRGVSCISPRSGDSKMYYGSDDGDGNGVGDNLSILAPTNELIGLANEGGDVNDASYVIVQQHRNGNVIFAGDSHDKTWNHILENHKDVVENAGILFAPHHGRKSDRDYSFLDVVKPRVTFFGNANSDHLAYSAWSNRGLLYFTANQCGNVRLSPGILNIDIFIENESFARAYTEKNNFKTYSEDGYWFLGRT